MKEGELCYLNSERGKGQRSDPTFLSQYETPTPPVKQTLLPGEVCFIFRQPY